MKKALMIAVHPDDETLGCGGTILRLASEKIELYWLIITEAKPGTGWSNDFIAKRELEIDKVKSFFSMKEVVKLGFPTTRLDTIPLGDIIMTISEHVQRIKPNLVFIPNHTDVHSDHKIGFEAAWSACKNFRAPFIEKIFMYECLSETEFAPPFQFSAFTPNTFIDITEFLNGKVEALKIFTSEIQMAPFPRSSEIITAMASFRGSRIGVKYAEAFSLIYSSNL